MKKSYWYKATLALLVSIKTLDSSAQTIEKIIPITFSDYPSLKTGISLTAIGVGSDQNLRVYGNQFIPGKFKNTGNATKTSGISFFSGSDMNSGANLISERVLSTNLDSLSSQHFILNTTKNEATSFDVATVADIAAKELPNSFDVLSASQVEAQFPILNRKEVLERKFLGAKFKTEGKGAWGLKEPKAYPVIIYSTPGGENETMASVTNPFVQRGSPLMLTPQREKAMEVLNGYVPAYQTEVLTTSDRKIYNGILSQKNEDDKWFEYRHFAFVTFDEQGNLTKDTTSFDYIRRVFYSSVVRDFEGKEKGFVYFFGGMVALGGKKEKDPMENNFQIVYLGLDGKIKYKYTFQKGNPNNKLGLQPVYVIEKEGKLLVWNLMNEKLLSTGMNEILVFDDKAMTTKVENVPLTVPELDNVRKFASEQGYLKMLYDNGKVTIVKQAIAKKSREVRTAVGGMSTTEEYNEYGDLLFTTFQANDKYPVVQVVPLSPSLEPIKSVVIDEGTSFYSVVLTAGNQNIFVKYNQGVLQSTIINKVKENESPLYIPSLSMAKYNFSVDKVNKKAYFIYRTAIPHVAKIVKIAY